MRGSNGRLIAKPKMVEFGFTAPISDKYEKEHAHSLQYLRWRWLYTPAYRHTPAEVGGIVHGSNEM